MAILNPAPRGPRILPSGTLQSSRMMLAVDEALMPNLSSFFPRESPGCGMGTRNALIPCRHGWQKAGEKSTKGEGGFAVFTIRTILYLSVWCEQKSGEKCGVIALCLSFLSVVANTTVADASQLLVIQALVPFSTHSSPSWWAVVEAAPASLPLPAV